MGRLDDITIDELHDVRTTTHEPIPRERVLAAIGRKQGDTLTRLAERHGVVEKTIRNWLDRFAEEPPAEAPYDDERSGRPPKLPPDQYHQLLDEFSAAPDAVGYDGEEWSTWQAGRHVRTKYGVVYSDRHVRFLLAEGQRDSD